MDNLLREAEIPSPSPIVYRLFEMMFDADTSLEDLAATLANDAGLTARTLRAANAAYSSPEHKIDNIRDAVVRIGLVATIHLISTTEIKAVFFAVPGQHGDMNRLWTHNLLVACLADAYAKQHRLEKPARWFTGGLLHDIGRLVLLRHDPVKYADVGLRFTTHPADICRLEQEAFGLTHEEVGAALMRFWQFPDTIAEAAHHHNQPFVAYDDMRTGICIANDLANALETRQALPEYADFSAQEIVDEAEKTFETMRKASGFN